MATGSTQNGKAECPDTPQADACADAAHMVLARHHDRVTCGQQISSDPIEPDSRAVEVGEKNNRRPSMD